MHESELTRSAKCGHSLSTRRTYIGKGSGLERPSMLINRLIAPLTAATVAVLTLGQAQRGVGQCADSLFDFLHKDRRRRAWHLRAAQSRTCGVARLRSAVGEERCPAVETGDAGKDGQHDRGADRRYPRCRAAGGGALPAYAADRR